jgi:hypothetical protein
MPPQRSAYLCQYVAKLLHAMPVTSHCFATAYQLVSVPMRFESSPCLNQTTLCYTITALYLANPVVSMPQLRGSQICTAFALLFNSMPLRCFSQLNRCRAYLCESFTSPCQA